MSYSLNSLKGGLYRVSLKGLYRGVYRVQGLGFRV